MTIEKKSELCLALEQVKKKQETIDSLLCTNLITTNSDSKDKWSLSVMYSKSDCTIAFSTCVDKSIGYFPNHSHPGVKEYLICIFFSLLIGLIA